MPNYDENYIQAINNLAGNSFSGTEVWIIVSCILSIIGGIFIYYAFVSPKAKNNYQGFLAKLYQFLNFRITIFEALLKIVYLIGALSITLSSFAFLGTNFFKFLYILVFGNILLRITFEVLLKLFILAKDVSEIRKDLLNNQKHKPKVAKTKKDE